MWFFQTTDKSPVFHIKVTTLHDLRPRPALPSGLATSVQEAHPSGLVTSVQLTQIKFYMQTV